MKESSRCGIGYFAKRGSSAAAAATLSSILPRKPGGQGEGAATIKGLCAATLQGPLNAGLADAEVAPPTVGSIFEPYTHQAVPPGTATP